MIDPTMVELKCYERRPHLWPPIVTDPKLASIALILAVAEMENRYRTLAECGVPGANRLDPDFADDLHPGTRDVGIENRWSAGVEATCFWRPVVRLGFASDCIGRAKTPGVVPAHLLDL